MLLGNKVRVTSCQVTESLLRRQLLSPIFFCTVFSSCRSTMSQIVGVWIGHVDGVPSASFFVHWHFLMEGLLALFSAGKYKAFTC